MAFPGKVLGEGEYVVADVRPHGVSLGFPIAWLLGFGIASFSTGISFDVPTSITRALALGGIVGALVIAALGLHRWATRAFVVTTQRFISRRGLFGRKYAYLAPENVAQVDLRQFLWQRRTDTAFVVLSPDTDGLPILSTRVRDADHIHALVCRQVATANETAAGVDAGPPGADPITTLLRLSALRDSGALSDEEFAHKKTDLLDRL